MWASPSACKAVLLKGWHGDVGMAKANSVMSICSRVLQPSCMPLKELAKTVPADGKTEGKNCAAACTRVQQKHGWHHVIVL